MSQGSGDDGVAAAQEPSVLGMRPDRFLFFELCISIWVAVANGSIFCFGLLSPALKADTPNGDKGLTITEVNIVSTVGAVASFLSLPTGILYDRYGPRLTLFVGAGVNCLGWFLLFLFFNGTLPHSAATAAVAFGISQLSASFYETGSVLTNLETFSLHQGKIVIIQKTFMGLGSSVIAMQHAAWFEAEEESDPARLLNDTKAFCLMLMVFNTAAGVLGGCIMRLPRADPLRLTVPGINVRPELAARYRLPLAYGVGLLCVAVSFVFGVNVVDAVGHPTQSTHVVFALVMIVIIVAFFGTLIFIRSGSRRTAEDDPEEVYTAVASNDQSPLDDEGCGEPTTPASPKAANDSDLLQNMRTPELWLLWFTKFCVWGASTMILSNSESIYRAVAGNAYTAQRNAMFVSVIGLASALGRVVVGFLDPVLEHRLNWPIWSILPSAPIMMVVGMPLFLLCPASLLVIPFFIVGFATGVSWGTTVLVIKRLFTAAGRHYNFLYTAGMLTPLFFNVFLFAVTYEQEGERQHRSTATEPEGDDAPIDCFGTACISQSMIAAAVLNFAAILSGAAFARLVSGGGLGWRKVVRVGSGSQSVFEAEDDDSGRRRTSSSQRMERKSLDL